MKLSYVVKQYFLKTLAVSPAILVIAAIILPVFYYSKRIDNSKIYISDYSSIRFHRVDCHSIDTDTNIYSFPIVLHYRTPDAQTSFQAKNGYYSARLSLWNTEAMYLTTGQDSVEIQNPEHTEINIQAKTFNWNSKVDPADFSLVEHLEWNRLYGNSGDEGGDNFNNIFDWIKPDPLFFTMGLCGEDLNYYPDEKAAGFTRLNSIALRTSPDAFGSADSTGKVALLIRFGDVASFSINNKNYLPAEEIELRVIQKNHSTIGGLDFVATEINDSDIAICDGFTQLEPGFVCQPSRRSTSDSEDELLNISGNAQTLTITSPSGYVGQRFIKTDLPEKTAQLIVSAQKNSVEISQEAQSDPLIITENISSVQADGSEQLRSRWEALTPELQNAYSSTAVAIVLGIIGIIASNWLRFLSFLRWLFSIPRYRQPVNLPANAYIFDLTNGKKISGIMKPMKGRSTYRVFVLTEVREWDKDNWSEVLPTEVRVPQNQIEMYYKAHP